MKRLLTFVLALFTTSFLFAQTYQYSAFPKQIAVWHFTEYNDYWNIIGGQNHQYVLDTISGLMVGSGAYFEENKRIYYVSGNDTTLMYDFNLTVGDTMVSSSPYATDTFTVVADDSISYFGRRSITLIGSSMSFLNPIWVEGIGVINGYFGEWEPFATASISGGLGFWCQYADSVSIPCNSALSSEEVESLSPQVFPNPTTGILHIKTITSGFDTFCLYDQLGRRLIFGPMQPQLDISLLPNGLYFLHIFGKEKTVIEKVMKQ